MICDTILVFHNNKHDITNEIYTYNDYIRLLENYKKSCIHVSFSERCNNTPPWWSELCNQIFWEAIPYISMGYLLSPLLPKDNVWPRRMVPGHSNIWIHCFSTVLRIDEATSQAHTNICGSCNTILGWIWWCEEGNQMVGKYQST